MLWAGDVRRKLLANIEAYGGDVALVTATAPGRDVLPYDASGEQVERSAARRWNRRAPDHWRRMHRLASQRAKRHARRHGGDWAVIAREWEFQRRGVLHVHVVVPMGSPLERMASQVYAEALSDLRHEHGFGYVDRGKRSRSGAVWRRSLEVIPAARAGRYLAKYVAPLQADGKLGLTDTVQHPDVPGHVVYVGRRLTAQTGITMRTLRRRRYAHMLLDGLFRRCEATGWFDPYEDAAQLSDDDVIELLAPSRGAPEVSAV